jgi:hypothetical protein
MDWRNVYNLRVFLLFLGIVLFVFGLGVYETNKGFGILLIIIAIVILYIAILGKMIIRRYF